MQILPRQSNIRAFAAPLLASLLLLVGCASTSARLPPPVENRQIAELAGAIRQMGEDIDWREADRAAQIAFNYSRQLADEYAISDSALMHNLKVNLGLRDRGLCIHWTEDLLSRLRRERFHSLEFHWANANADNPFRLEHSTAVVSRRGETLYRGLVLDPWRNAGALFWAPTLADTRYHWRPLNEVLAEKARIREAGNYAKAGFDVMSTRIGLISDVHASPAALRDALDIFKAEQVDDIICAGDIAGYFDALAPVVEMLKAAGCRTISGNHDIAWLEDPDNANLHSLEYDYLSALPKTLSQEIEGLRVYVVHAEPPEGQHGGIKLLDPDGDMRPDRREEWRQRLQGFNHDVLIVGHTHQVYAEQLGDVLVVNPGSTPFNHSCMILTLPELEIQAFALEGKEIVRCWNFGMLRG